MQPLLFESLHSRSLVDWRTVDGALAAGDRDVPYSLENQLESDYCGVLDHTHPFAYYVAIRQVEAILVARQQAPTRFGGTEMPMIGTSFHHRWAHLFALRTMSVAHQEGVQ